VSTPTDIKAQAIALLILGRSCREARAELHQIFAGESIPHYSTIARWLQKMAEPQSKGALAYWSVLVKAVGEVVFRRMDELEKMSLLEVVAVSSRAYDIYWALRERGRAGA